MRLAIADERLGPNHLSSRANLPKWIRKHVRDFPSLTEIIPALVEFFNTARTLEVPKEEPALTTTKPQDNGVDLPSQSSHFICPSCFAGDAHENHAPPPPPPPSSQIPPHYKPVHCHLCNQLIGFQDTRSPHSLEDLSRFSGSTIPENNTQPTQPKELAGMLKPDLSPPASTATSPKKKPAIIPSPYNKRKRKQPQKPQQTYAGIFYDSDDSDEFELVPTKKQKSRTNTS